MSDKARLAAYNAVKRINDGAFSNLISYPDNLTGIDRNFAERIAVGTVERKLSLEFILNELIRSSTDKHLKCLLLTALYQIFYMDRVPGNAICDETVEIAKALFGSKRAGFTNAVLRNACRNKENLRKKLESASAYIRLSVNKELYDLINEQYPDECDKIFEAFFGKQPVYLRVNTLKSDALKVADATNGTVCDDTAVLCGDVQKALSIIDNGDFYIQGKASQKAVRLLDAQRGHTVIDVCACPGGKSIGAAIDMCNEGKIYSFDIHKNKLPLIEKSAQALGITIIETDVCDGKAPKKELFGVADRVICDVPCSGTGVMGSKPEIKYKSPSEFDGIYRTQRIIIENAAKYLKVGGIMVYSTCSINKIENEETVRAFLASNPSFSLLHDETCLPFGEEKEGFYMAKIIREF